MCRITVNGKIAQFSCKLDVEEKLWSVEMGRLTGRSTVALQSNRMLDKIRVGVNKVYQDVCDRNIQVDKIIKTVSKGTTTSFNWYENKESEKWYSSGLIHDDVSCLYTKDKLEKF